MKMCSKCKVEKSLEKFHKDPSKGDGLHSCCKQCKNIHYLKVREIRLVQIKKWKSENIEYLRKLNRKRYALNPEFYREKFQRNLYKRVYGEGWEEALSIKKSMKQINDFLKECENEKI